MEAHGILSEKMILLEHLSLYASQCHNITLRQMIEQQIQHGIQSYNELAAYTHDYHAVSPYRPRIAANPQEVRYGLRSPSPEAPQLGGQRFSDKQIAGAVLILHKNCAKNHMAAALECADPNLWQLMLNGAVACAEFAYQLFHFMNQNGWYQLPTMDSHTAKTLLHAYQPVHGAPFAYPTFPSNIAPQPNFTPTNCTQPHPFV
jgi:spore coat protein CotF